MGFFGRIGKAILGETAYQTFNNYLSNIVRKRNASIVGPSKQITGEFPDVDFPRLYEFYHGWDQVKRSVDTMHQKFMGAGLEVNSEDEKFDEFIKKWMEIVNFQKKMGDFFLSTFITGNGILELQYTEDGKIGSIEQVPMQTIYRIFRDEFGKEIKIVQNIDGVFKELDPEYYVHWSINNPDRQAFGKSEFFTLAAPRKVSAKVDPDSGQPINPERTMTSLLDAQAELQNAEVEIKKIMAKPRIFASFPGMQRKQLDDLQLELQDPNSSQYIWAFDKEAKMAEAQVSNNSKFDDYGDNVDSHIDIGTGFASKVVSKPGGFSYSSSQTPFDVLDQRMLDMQNDAKEMLRDTILRPVAESWGFEDFDDYDVEIHFKPTVRRLSMEDIQKLPVDAVSVLERREILKDLNIPLDDELWEKSQSEAMLGQGASKPSQNQTQSGYDKGTPEQKRQNPPLQAPMAGKSPIGGKSNAGASTGEPKIDPLHADSRPRPSKEAHPIFTNPKAFESYMDGIVAKSINKAMERITISPKINTSDSYVPGGLNEEEGGPEITDPDIETQLENELDFDPSNPEQQNPNQEPRGPADEPEQITKDGTPNEKPTPQTGTNRDLTNGAGNSDLDKRTQDNANPHTSKLGQPNPVQLGGTAEPEQALKMQSMKEPKRMSKPDPSEITNDANTITSGGNVDIDPELDMKDPSKTEKHTAYRGVNAPNPNDNFDISGPIDTPDDPKKTAHVPKQVPDNLNKQLQKKFGNRTSLEGKNVKKSKESKKRTKKMVGKRTKK